MRVTLDPADLRPLVEAVVAETLKAADHGGGDAIALPEAEAAQRLGMQSHQLRDRRLAGEVVGTRLGGRWFYELSELRAYAARNREEAS